MVKIATTFMTTMVQTSACWGGAMIHILQYVRRMLFASPEQLHIHITACTNVEKQTHTHTKYHFWPKHQRVQSMRPNVHVRSMEGWRGLPWTGIGKTNQKQFWMDDCDCMSRTDGLKMKLLLVVHIQDCLVLPQMHFSMDCLTTVLSKTHTFQVRPNLKERELQ